MEESSPPPPGAAASPRDGSSSDGDSVCDGFVFVDGAHGVRAADEFHAERARAAERAAERARRAEAAAREAARALAAAEEKIAAAAEASLSTLSTEPTAAAAAASLAEDASSAFPAARGARPRGNKAPPAGGGAPLCAFTGVPLATQALLAKLRGEGEGTSDECAKPAGERALAADGFTPRASDALAALASLAILAAASLAARAAGIGGHGGAPAPPAPAPTPRAALARGGAHGHAHAHADFRNAANGGYFETSYYFDRLVHDLSMADLEDLFDAAGMSTWTIDDVGNVARAGMRAGAGVDDVEGVAARLNASSAASSSASSASSSLPKARAATADARTRACAEGQASPCGFWRRVQQHALSGGRAAPLFRRHARDARETTREARGTTREARPRGRNNQSARLQRQARLLAIGPSPPKVNPGVLDFMLGTDAHAYAHAGPSALGVFQWAAKAARTQLRTLALVPVARDDAKESPTTNNANAESSAPRLFSLELDSFAFAQGSRPLHPAPGLDVRLPSLDTLVLRSIDSLFSGAGGNASAASLAVGGADSRAAERAESVRVDAMDAPSTTAVPSNLVQPANVAVPVLKHGVPVPPISDDAGPATRELCDELRNVGYRRLQACA